MPCNLFPPGLEGALVRTPLPSFGGSILSVIARRKREVTARGERPVYLVIGKDMAEELRGAFGLHGTDSIFGLRVAEVPQHTIRVYDADDFALHFCEACLGQHVFCLECKHAHCGCSDCWSGRAV